MGASSGSAGNSGEHPHHDQRHAHVDECRPGGRPAEPCGAADREKHHRIHTRRDHVECGSAPVVRERVLQHEDRECQKEHPRAVRVGEAQQTLSALRSPILPRQRHEQGSQLDRADAQGQHHMGRTQDLDIESVGVVPPVVERSGGEHRDRAPDRHPRPEGRAKSPHAHRAPDFGAGAGKGRPQGQPAAGQAGRQATRVDRE